ncbi:hypothetical protein [Streptomyces sp. NPDC005009]
MEELDSSARTRCSASADAIGVVVGPLCRRCRESASGARSALLRKRVLPYS